MRSGDFAVFVGPGKTQRKVTYTERQVSKQMSYITLLCHYELLKTVGQKVLLVTSKYFVKSCFHLFHFGLVASVAFSVYVT